MNSNYVLIEAVERKAKQIASSENNHAMFYASLSGVLLGVLNTMALKLSPENVETLQRFVDRKDK